MARRARTTVSFPARIHRALKAKAAKTDRSLSDLAAVIGVAVAHLHRRPGYWAART